MNSKQRVAYFHSPQIGKFQYTTQHLMNPKRISMTHSLINGFGLFSKLNVYQAREASKEQLIQFHSKDYIQYLENYVWSQRLIQYSKINQELPIINNAVQNQQSNKQKFNIDIQPDCPGFDGLYTFNQLSSGNSIDAAYTIIENLADVAINWCGGFHHAHRSDAYGFCYVNDIVLCILELLKNYMRVLYVDIDVHHGDGVEQAFVLTNRVMTVSFHQFGEDFFPGTGGLEDIGDGDGKYYSINVPLKRGIDDNTFIEIFQSVMTKVVDSYRPNVIVFQSGADSLSRDQIGNFNLSISGHGSCLEHMFQFGLPVIVLGGGGYTLENVARCWAYETGIALGQKITDNIRPDDTYSYMYNNQFKLHLPVSFGVLNENTKEDIHKLLATVHEYIRNIQGAPNVPFHDVPQSFRYEEIDEQEGQSDYFGEQEIKRFPQTPTKIKHVRNIMSGYKD